MRRGFSEADIEKISNGNALRAMRAVEAVGRKLRETRKPAVGRIEDYPGA
jgi:hypothetical protein